MYKFFVLDKGVFVTWCVYDTITNGVCTAQGLYVDEKGNDYLAYLSIRPRNPSHTPLEALSDDWQTCEIFYNDYV